MPPHELDYDGDWPDLAGKTLERLIVQEAWFEGDRDDEANVVWICAGGAWHKLYFDDGIACWQTSAAPEAGGADFPLVDLGAKHGVAGEPLTGCHGEAREGGAAITLAFARGASVSFHNRYDATTIQVG